MSDLHIDINHFETYEIDTLIKCLKNQEVSSLVECGPGKVLSGLNKRIHEQTTLFNLNSSESLIILTDYLK